MPGLQLSLNRPTRDDLLLSSSESNGTIDSLVFDQTPLSPLLATPDAPEPMDWEPSDGRQLPSPMDWEPTNDRRPLSSLFSIYQDADQGRK